MPLWTRDQVQSDGWPKQSPTNRQLHPHRPQHIQQRLQRHIAARPQRLGISTIVILNLVQDPPGFARSDGDAETSSA